jgi:hypothetical protein
VKAVIILLYLLYIVAVLAFTVGIPVLLVAAAVKILYT